MFLLEAYWRFFFPFCSIHLPIDLSSIIHPSTIISPVIYLYELAEDNWVESIFSFHFMSSETKLRSSGLAAGTFPTWVNSLAHLRDPQLPCNFCALLHMYIIWPLVLWYARVSLNLYVLMFFFVSFLQFVLSYSVLFYFILSYFIVILSMPVSF